MPTPYPSRILSSKPCPHERTGCGRRRFSQLVLLAPLYGVPGSLGFCAPLRFVRYQLRYVKGLFVALNGRSVYTRNMLRYTVLGAGLRQFEGSNWECVCKCLPSFQLQFRPVGPAMCIAT